MANPDPIQAAFDAQFDAAQREFAARVVRGTGHAEAPCPCKVDPHQGMRFAHARMRQALPGLRIADQPPQVCRVTRVTARAVYYRTGDGQGSRYVIDPARFPELVGELLPDA